jgi:hypothetical protein
MNRDAFGAALNHDTIRELLLATKTYETIMGPF